MPGEHEKKVMFEIYRDSESRRYQVVYFTELDEHEREAEISRAMHGEHVFDGFLLRHSHDLAKRTVNGILDRLNRGEPMPPAEIESQLKPFLG